MTFQKLKGFLASPRKKAILRFKVHYMISENEYTVSDESQSCKLHLDDTFSKGRKHISSGSFLRCIFPADSASDGTLTLDSGSTVVLSTPFKALDVPNKGLDSSTSSTESLLTAENSRPGDKVHSIVVKVLKIGPTRKAGKGQVSRISIKDKDGRKNWLSLWGSKRDEVTEGQVYRFKALKVENYPPDSTVKYLSTTFTTTIEEVQDRTFDAVTITDDIYTGTCLGITEFYFYLSCPFCHKKINDGASQCQSCKKDIDKPENDFKAEILLQLEDDVKNIVVFCNKLGELLHKVTLTDTSEVECKLNDELSDKTIKIGVTLQRDGTPVANTIHLV